VARRREAWDPLHAEKIGEIFRFMPQQTLIFFTNFDGDKRMAVADGLNQRGDCVRLHDKESTREYPLKRIREVQIAEHTIGEINLTGGEDNPRGYWVLDWIRPRTEVGPPPENTRFRVIGKHTPELVVPNILDDALPLVADNIEFITRAIEGAGAMMSVVGTGKGSFQDGVSLLEATVEKATGLLIASGSKAESSYDHRTQEIIHFGILTGMERGKPTSSSLKLAGLIVGIDGLDKLQQPDQLLMNSDPAGAVFSAANYYNDRRGMRELGSVRDWYNKG